MVSFVKLPLFGSFLVKYVLRIRVVMSISLLAFSVSALFGQTTLTGVTVIPGAADAYGALTAMGVVHEKENAAVEIIVSKPVVPVIQKLEGPPRLVIDLPKTRTALKQKRINVRQLQINAMRADQYQANPPVARVVVELTEDCGFTWNTIGNRLLIHLTPTAAKAEPAQTQPETPSVPSLSPGPQPAVVPVTAGGSGPVVLGSRVAAGSAITAGAETTILKLARGGEIRVCPGTTVSVTSSQTGRDLMLGMSTGTLETHYRLKAAADSILTPDFRILMPGPGEFNYAVSADARGNTCVRALPGNSASVIVSELMGDRTYQVRATDEVLIHDGRLDRVDTATPLDCGCPAPATPVLRASAADPAVIADDKVPSAMRLGGSGGQPEPVESPVPETVPPSGAPPADMAVTVTERKPLPPPPPRSSQSSLRIEAPLVFRGTDPPEAPTEEAERLPIMTVAPQPKFQTLVVAPPGQQKRPGAKPAHHGFFGKIKGLFSAMFG